MNQNSQLYAPKSCLMWMSNCLEILSVAWGRLLDAGLLSKIYPWPCLALNLSCHVSSSQGVAWLVLNKSAEFFTQNGTGRGWHAAIINSYASLLSPKRCLFLPVLHTDKTCSQLRIQLIPSHLYASPEVGRGYYKMQQEWERSWELLRLRGASILSH